MRKNTSFGKSRSTPSDKPRGSAPRSGKPQGGKPQADRPWGEKKPQRAAGSTMRGEARPARGEGQAERTESGFARGGKKPYAGKPRADKPWYDAKPVRPEQGERKSFGQVAGKKTYAGKPRYDKDWHDDRPAQPRSEQRPARDGQAKPFAGKPRPEKSWRGGKPVPPEPGERPTAPRPVAARPALKPFVKPAKPAPVGEAPRRFGQGQLLHGFHAVQAAWLNPARQCRQLWLTPAAEASFAPVLAQAAERKLNRPVPQTTERGTLDTMLPGTVHQGIALDAAPLPEITLNDLLARQPRLVLVLDQVTDPHNVGAMLRSAAAFGAEAVILTERHAPGTTGTLAKTASGALEVVPLIAVVNLARALEQLREAGFWCVGLAEEGEKALGDHDLSGPTALVLGAEGEGLRRLTRERCDALAHLPTQGEIKSLNVSNAAAIALYEAKRQKK